jgi:ribose/xylose/arabinose/galactoside ABC-type transport system permease subunit
MPTHSSHEPSGGQPLWHARRGFTLGGLRYVQEAGLVGVILLLVIFLTLASPDVTVGDRTSNAFLRIDNLLPNVATSMSHIAIMALGATMVIIAGGIDISVGSIYGLSALGCAAVLQQFPPDASPWVVIPVGMAVPIAIGLGCGLLNGLLVAGLRLHPFIVTLGTMSILRGIALVAVETKSIPSTGRMIPEAFTTGFLSYQINSGPLAWAMLQPVPMVIMLVCVAAAWVYLGHTAAGRRIYAIGGNPEAARFSGISVNRTTIGVFALSGLACGIAGMVNCGYRGSANTATGEGYELMVIAAAAVGGASMSGGRGTALGALLGALIIQLITNGITTLGQLNFGVFVLKVSTDYTKIIVGVAIIVAVAVDRAGERLRTRLVTRQRHGPQEPGNEPAGT